VQVPAAYRGLLAPGCEVSLALCRALSGWVLVGSALPVPEDGPDGPDGPDEPEAPDAPDAPKDPDPGR
jgi:hypothetical protein